MDTADEHKPCLPSEAYDRACESYVYRLSELMFGSLLAAYLLGFLAFCAQPSLTPPPDATYLTIVTCVLRILQYILICLSYCFTTAALYANYHGTLLTMPNRHDSEITKDFALAVIQAIFFGLSMLYPSTNAIWVALLAFLASRLHSRAAKALAHYMYRRAQRFKGPRLHEFDDRNHGDADKAQWEKTAEQRWFQALSQYARDRAKLDERNCFLGWQKLPRWQIPMLAVPFSIGIGLFLLRIAAPPTGPEGIANIAGGTNVVGEIVTAGTNVIVAVLCIVLSTKSLKARAPALIHRRPFARGGRGDERDQTPAPTPGPATDMDAEFHKLWQCLLEQIPNSNSQSTP